MDSETQFGDALGVQPSEASEILTELEVILAAHGLGWLSDDVSHSLAEDGAPTAPPPAGVLMFLLELLRAIAEVVSLSAVLRERIFVAGHELTPEDEWTLRDHDGREFAIRQIDVQALDELLGAINALRADLEEEADLPRESESRLTDGIQGAREVLRMRAERQRVELER